MPTGRAPVDELGRRPPDSLLLLFSEHVVQDGHYPVLELAVVVVRHQQIADPVESLRSEPPRDTPT